MSTVFRTFAIKNIYLSDFFTFNIAETQMYGLTE